MTSLIVFLFSVAIVGFFGNIITMPHIEPWYQELSKPSFTPPSWVFGPAWFIFYLLMAVAAWLVWKKGKSRAAPLSIFYFQLGLNLLWFALFFAFHTTGWALIEIIFLWLVVLWMLVGFWKNSRCSVLLLLPYIFWLSFIVVVNAGIYFLN